MTTAKKTTRKAALTVADIAALTKATTPAAAPAAAVTVVTITDKDKAHAEKIYTAWHVLEGAQSSMFQTVRAAFADGATSAGMEASKPELKDCTAYRTAKSICLAAVKAGVKLVTADNGAKSKSALQDETNKKNGKVDAAPAAGKKGARVPNGNNVKPVNEDAAIASVLAVLIADVSKRKQFAAQITELATLAKKDAQIAMRLMKKAA